jgi:hypothetical protein
MEAVWGAVIALAAGAGGAAVSGAVWMRQRRRDREWFERIHQVRILAQIEAPNRDLGATLPQRNQASANADRYFALERARDPRFRPDQNTDEVDALRPVQIVRVDSDSEREALSQDAPAHIRVHFVAEQRPPRRVSGPIPTRKESERQKDS